MAVRGWSMSLAVNLVDILGRHASVRPNEIAYTFLADGESETRELTYWDLDRKAKSVGALLQSINAPGERALLLYPFGSEFEFITAFFACLYSAVTAVPIYPPAPGRINRSLPRLTSIFEDAQPAIVLTTTSLLSLADHLRSADPRFHTVRWIATDPVDGVLALSQEW
jgi:acyl-CoA synthetase (AMP-forming)/AMP-acid ligase II